MHIPALLAFALLEVVAVILAIRHAYRTGYGDGLRTNAPTLPPLLGLQDFKPRRTERQ